MAALNYFTCTLGEAKKSSCPCDYDTVNTLLELQASHHPNSPAVAFPILKGSRYQIFTFRQLYEGSLKSAACLPLDGERGCVGLLCASSVNFLFAWLGLIRAGYSVLLIAPQCSESAINALCKSCEVFRLYHDEAHSGLASAATKEPHSHLQALPIPWEKPGISNLLEYEENTSSGNWPRLSSEDVAYIHHSSGTSTGIPKPIPQTHHGAVAVLPSLQGQDAATFTTTPLYHGGIADCFRAWTSNAFIWLFPGADAPITSATILSCLSIATMVVSKVGTPPVRYFSSVPYVLQMLSNTRDGLGVLQSMEIVGVGGAALPETVGDRLVKENVNLVSRFGSAECGFLLSSHREFASDNWQYLRVSDSSHLLLEREESGLSQLIVLSSWPHMAKRNRDDGSYATSDLFQPHPNIKNAWKYNSRSDSQITLLTGKKFDPAPIEDDVKSRSAIIEDVLIFGNGKQVPGAIVFLSRDHVTDALREEIWKTLKNVNSTQQPHTRISQNMFETIYRPYTPLERSSKGTLLRSQAEDRYASKIRDMYEPNRTAEHSDQSFSNESVDSTIRRIFAELVGEDNFADDADFFHCGVDSTKATQIRSRLQEIQAFVHDNLPWNIVYDCQNMRRIIQYFTGEKTIVASELPGQHVEMIQLAKEYSKYDLPQPTQREQPGSSDLTVVLTGATGGLGAHILNALQNDSSVNRIVCLVRAADSTEARKRVSESLTKRKLPPLPAQGSEDKIWCIPVQLGDPQLGISTEVIGTLKENTTHIIHAAWAVNFSLPLQSFVKEHIAGLRNLINLATSCRNFQHFAFCSSTASVIGQVMSKDDLPIREQIYHMPPADNSLGYSKSKWIAETLCSKAFSHFKMTSRISVLRIGQLTGDTQNGVWNRSEAWPLMLSTAKELGCLPKLEEHLSWLPVDLAARAVVDISLLGAAAPLDRTCTVYHIVNNDRSTSWTDMLRWVNKWTRNEVSVVEPSMWLDKLEDADHPARSLLGLWRNSFGIQAQGQGNESSHTRQDVVFDTKNAAKGTQCMRDVGPVDEALVGKIWHWLNGSE
ncbi:acetyl-CoA synthetase-like protein [Cadophora sp. DSE1049]|nr:acetyl-CoA synthetase-like protein [Cadophora sp. DSE1049]